LWNLEYPKIGLPLVESIQRITIPCTPPQACAIAGRKEKVDAQRKDKERKLGVNDEEGLI
jgi:hypothetical protein